jgi:hypothetical protein
MTPLACVEALQTHFTAALTAAAAAAKAKANTQPAPAVAHYRMSSTGVPLSPLPLRKLSGAVPPLLPPPPSHRSANNSINNNNSVSSSSSSSSRGSSSVLTSDLLTGLNAELVAEQSAERSAEQAAGGSSAELSPRRARLLNSAKIAAATTAAAVAAPAAAVPAPATVVPAPAAVVPAVVAAAYVGQCVWRALHAASRTASGGDSFFIVQDLFGGEGVLIKAARTAPPPIELVLAGLSLKVY